MNYEEIIFFEKLGFGWAVNKGVAEEVFPEATDRQRRNRERMTADGLERRKSVRR